MNKSEKQFPPNDLQLYYFVNFSLILTETKIVIFLVYLIHTSVVLPKFT